MLNDLRYVFRSLARNRGFAFAFILTLGLGIGANTAIFSVVNGVLLKPLPYPDADRIMFLRQPARRAGVDNINFSFVEIDDYRRRSRTLSEFVEFGDWTFNVLGRGDPHRATGGLVTANFFTVLGLKPLLGRLMTVEDEGRAAQPVAVLTFEYWVRALGADPNIVGQILDLTTKKAVIVGVLEPGSHYAAMRKQDFYCNYASNDHYLSAAMQDERNHRMTDLFAKLAPGATPEAARQEIQAIFSQLKQEYPDAYPDDRGLEVAMTPWRDELTQRARPTLLILLGTAGFVLLIACANVANLTLTRLVSRERELAVRAALGAGVGRLRRLLLTENLVLSLLGAAGGLAVAVATKDLLVRYTARFTLRTGEIEIDLAVLLFALAVTLAAAVFFAWAPRLDLARDPAPAMAAGANNRATGALSRRRLQRLLVVAQLGFSFLLLVGAGLLLRSLVKLHAVDPGFDLSNVLTMDAPDYSRREQEQRHLFTRSVVEQVSGYGGVESAAVASAAPLGRSFTLVREFRVEGAPEEAVESPPPSTFVFVTPRYFETIGTALERGRDFTAGDDSTAAPAAILSRSMARYYFPDRDPLGRRISWKNPGGNWSNPVTVVGVAADNKSEGLDKPSPHTLYLPAAQTYAPSTVLVRTQGDPLPHLRQIVSAIHNLDPNRPVDNIRTLEEARLESIAPQRLNATLFGIFAALALAIAAVGTGGILAFSVSQRTQEIGIRMALGADRKKVLWMVLKEGGGLALLGLVLGAAGALALSRFLSELLFEVDPVDPLTLAGVGLTLGVVACIASLVPARRAARVDPVHSLRSE